MGANPKEVWLNDGFNNNITSTVSGTKRPLDVLLYDASGNPIVTFAGTEYTDGDSIDTDSPGTLVLGTTDISGVSRVLRCGNDGILLADATLQIAGVDNSETVPAHVGITSQAEVNLSALEDDYDSAKTNNSADQTRSAGCNMIYLYLDISKTGTPGMLQVEYEGKRGTDYGESGAGFQQVLKFSSASVGTGIKRWYPLWMVPCTTFRISATSSGTADVSNHHSINSCYAIQASGGGI